MIQQFHFDIYTQIKTEYQRDISIPMFIATLVTVVNIWEQPRCVSMVS